MADEIYQPRITPEAGAPLPLASPEVYGAGLGQAVEQAGDTIHDSQIRAYDIQRRLTADREAADFAHKRALLQQNLDTTIQTLRTQPADDNFTTHVADAMQAFRDQSAGLTDGITQDSVRNEAMRQLDSDATRLHGQETEYAAVQQIAKQAEDRTATMGLLANHTASGGDPLQALQQWHDATAGSQYGTPAERMKLDQLGLHTISDARVQYLTQQNPAQTKSDLDAGLYDAVLTPEQLFTAKERAEAEVRRRQVQADSEAAFAKSQIEEQITLANDRVEKGEVIAPDVLTALQVQADRLGASDPKKFVLQGVVARSGVNHVYAAAMPDQIATDMQPLIAKGEKRSDEESQRLAAMQSLYTARRAEMLNNPMDFASQAGVAVQPIDWAQPNPALVQQRQTQAYAVADASKFPLAPLQQPEVDQFKAQYATGGGQARLDILHALDAFPDDFARGAAARQVAPADVQFQHLAQIEPNQRQMVTAGQQAIKGNPQILEPAPRVSGLPYDPTGLKAMYRNMDAEITQALKTFNPQDIDAVKQTAHEWLAGYMQSQGRDNAEGFVNRDVYRTAIRVALGGGVVHDRQGNGTAVGGIGHWGDGTAFVLPEKVTPGNFGSLVVADARAARAAGAGPVDKDGKTPFNLNQARPVFVGGGRYQWETDAGTVKDAHNHNYISYIGTPRP